MTAFTTLAGGLVAVGAKPFATTIQALRDNPVAIAECDLTAPVNAACWHPYNKVIGNDANDGKFYDFATDGALATIQTPTLQDNWEYRIRFEGIGGTASGDLQIELRRETAGAYSGVGVLINNPSGSVAVWGFVELPTVAKSLQSHPINGVLRSSGLASNQIAAGSAVALAQDLTAADTIDRARISYSSGNTNKGKMFLDKRRTYIG